MYEYFAWTAGGVILTEVPPAAFHEVAEWNNTWVLPLMHVVGKVRYATSAGFILTLSTLYRMSTMTRSSERSYLTLVMEIEYIISIEAEVNITLPSLEFRK